MSMAASASEEAVVKDIHEIAVVHGDGVGPEVCAAAIDVVKAALGNRSSLNFRRYPAGGTAFPQNGRELS
jgi:3-isopropylmalate dehydrogenase